MADTTTVTIDQQKIENFFKQLNDMAEVSQDPDYREHPAARAARGRVCAAPRRAPLEAAAAGGPPMPIGSFLEVSATRALRAPVLSLSLAKKISICVCEPIKKGGRAGRGA